MTVKARLLLVEDNPIEASMIQHRAQAARTEFVVDKADTYDAAVEKIEHHDYDLILADFCLPGVHDGCEIAYEAPGKTVIMTGYGIPEIERKAQRARALACIPKADIIKDPEKLDELLQRAQAHTLGIEVTQNRKIADLKSRLDASNKRRTGLMGALDWIGSHPALFLAVLGLLITLIVAAVVIGSWPGG